MRCKLRGIPNGSPSGRKGQKEGHRWSTPTAQPTSSSMAPLASIATSVASASFGNLPTSNTRMATVAISVVAILVGGIGTLRELLDSGTSGEEAEGEEAGNDEAGK